MLDDNTMFYKNEDALSLGFMVLSDIKKWDIAQGSPMEVQSQFAKSATGVGFPYQLREFYALEEGITYEIKLEPGEQTYLQCVVGSYFDTNGNDIQEHCSITIQTSQYKKTFIKFFENLFDLGMVEESDTAYIMMRCDDGFHLEEPISVYVYTCENTDYEAVYQELARHQVKGVSINGNQMSGTLYTADTGTLLLTIPYDAGWNVYVNGELADIYPIGGALIGLDLEPGSYEVFMKFVPDGFYVGSFVSVVSIILFIITCMYEDKKTRKRVFFVVLFSKIY